jgi:hypothetical protein
MNKTQELRNKWTEHARAMLKNRKIVDARYPTDEQREEGAEGLLIVLDNGAIWTVMQDDEGNGPGALALAYTTNKTPVAYTELVEKGMGGILPVVP